MRLDRQVHAALESAGELVARGRPAVPSQEPGKVGRALTALFSAPAAENFGAEAAIWIVSPVCGLRP